MGWLWAINSSFPAYKKKNNKNYCLTPILPTADSGLRSEMLSSFKSITKSSHTSLKPISEGFSLQNIPTVRWKKRIQFCHLQTANTELPTQSHLHTSSHKMWWDHRSSKSNISAKGTEEVENGAFISHNHKWFNRIHRILHSLFSAGKTAITLVIKKPA